ncbi:MAG: phosphoribosylanthranilate isomerase [Chloroflexota bacterium]
MLRIKICGLTNLDDALAAVQCGADALGFVFANSPRQVEPETVQRIVAELPPLVFKVGVFSNAPIEHVLDTMRRCNLDLVQLHGQESPEYCRALYPRVIKAFAVQHEHDLLPLADYKVAGYLLDRPKSPAGQPSGKGYDWRLARQAARYGPVILAGHLNPDNVMEAVITARPYGVDVSSGVETRPGRKDKERMRAFVEAARAGAIAISCP